MKQSQPLLKQIPYLLLCLIIGILACNYYKPVQKTGYATNPKVMDSLLGKTFIVHTSRGIFLLQNMQLFAEREEITGIVAPVPEEHKMYLNDKRKKYKYDPKRPVVIQEVHLYTNIDSVANVGSNVTIRMPDIVKLELIERDRGKSTGATVLTIMGITIGSIAIISALAVALKGSCPFISVYNGEEYVLQGETFGGAIYPSLAREDFIPLPDAAIGQEIKLCISNELKERQFTDFARILLVEHAPGSKILMSPDGKLLKLKNKIPAKQAQLNSKSDMLKHIDENDNISCAFNDTLSASPINRLVVTYPHPGAGKPLGLVVNLRNSQWLEYAFYEFTRHFGERYNEWIEQQKQKPVSEILAWQESQHLPLTISVKTKTGWQEVIKLKTIGPLMNREVAIPLDAVLPDSDSIEVAFSTGFMFWEIDRVQLAELELVPKASIKFIDPSIAKDEKGKNVLPYLQQFDNSYLAQPEIGNRAYLTYKVPGYASVKTYSAFISSRGYYEPIRNFSGPADLMFLNKMRAPNSLTAFSREKYQQVIQSAYLAAKTN